MTNQAHPSPSAHAAETQSQRWIKYGANVALASVLVILVAALLTYIAQRHDARVDVTSNRVYSLKPQTMTVIRDIPKSPSGGPGITLVSLYTHTNAPARANANDDEADQATSDTTDQSQTVADLLDEYQRKGKNVDVLVIDPVNEKDKLAKLHDRLVSDYGGSIQGYRDFLSDWEKKYKQISQTLNDQSAAIAKLTGESLGGEDEAVVPGLDADVVRTVKASPRWLTDMSEEVDRERARKYPDWKAATNTVTDYLQRLSKNADAIGQRFAKNKVDKAISEPVRKYITDSIPVYQQIKKDADDLIARSKKLGELKVDQLEAALNVDNPILVLGPTEWRILSHNQIWPEDADMRNMVGGKLRPRFAGEQQVTAAIYSLTTNKKPKLVFVRPGGAPLTTAGIPLFQQAGPFSQIAERMRQYNFEVSEKDLSGMWAMQSRMQQMPPGPPEPTDEEMKDAVWVVLDFPSQGQQGMPPPQIGPKLREHLGHGGSAMVLFFNGGDPLTSALSDWGVELHPEVLGVHQPIKLTQGSPTDLLERAQAQPAVFFLRDYGDSTVTRPLSNLLSVMVQPMVVRTFEKSGYTVDPILPLDPAVPGAPVWGETQDIEGVLRGDTVPTYDKGTDLAPPINTGAVVEKKGGGRLVVAGSPFFTNQFLDIPDIAQSQKVRRFVAQFPGNGELAANSFFWLARLDPMIAISPAAMDISRIDNMSSSALGFWRYGVLLVLLPVSVVIAGLFVYMGRRD